MRERRREPRTEVDIRLQVWGIDTKGDRFLQQARARDVSLSGALITELDAELRSGDLVGVLFGARKARFRVVWVRCSATSRKVEAAIHRLEEDDCPWESLLRESVVKS
jgi:PilZ domain